MTDKKGIGVVVGRFQVDALHPMHRELIDTALARHNKVLVLVGVAPVEGVLENPLDFQLRFLMFSEEYPDDFGRSLIVQALADTQDDGEWSASLDAAIRAVFPRDKATLYGGRDSFAKYYSGRHQVTDITLNVLSLDAESGTSSRAEVGQSPPDTGRGFRRGYIRATQDAGIWGRAVPTVDVALFATLDTSKTRPGSPTEDMILKYPGVPAGKPLVLLGRKPGEKLWRFPGGFVDPYKDDSGEAAASRELQEETSLQVAKSDMRYVAQVRMDDWRYKRSSRIFTTLFATVMDPFPPQWEASDDLETLAWLDASDETVDQIEPVHKTIFLSAVRWYDKDQIARTSAVYADR